MNLSGEIISNNIFYAQCKLVLNKPEGYNVDCFFYNDSMIETGTVKSDLMTSSSVVSLTPAMTLFFMVFVIFNISILYIAHQISKEKI